jgi:type I restriction enzyme S subunit
MKTKYLSEVTYIKSGNSAPQGEEPFVNGKYNFYRTYDVGQIKQGEIFESRDKVNKATYSNLKIFPVNTILFPKSGASTFNNNRVIIKKEGAVASHLAGIKANSEFLNDYYLYYFLLTIDAKNLAQDSAYPSVNLKQISQIKIPVPSLQEQEKIVERLDKVFKNIDKKIELNLSNKLEALEESILEEEFFNKEKFQKLENYVELIMGQAPPKSETNFSGKGTLFVKTGEFGDERPVSKEYTTKPLKLAKSTDVLISVVGATCGKINYGIDCAIGRSVAAIRPLSNLNQDYLYYLMKSYTKKLRKGSTGAAQTVINKNMINNVLIPDISKNDQDKTVGEIKTIFSKLENLIQLQEKVNEKLILLKKSILNNEFSYE